MQAGGDPLDSGLGDLEALVANKEREWKELHARRIHVLEDSLKKAKEECSSLRHQYKKLKEDFQYNLSILDEREKELQRYDVITSRAVNAEQNRQEELSRLRIQVAVLEEKQAKDAEARQEEQRISENKAAQQRLQLDELRHSMTGTIQKQMEANERMKLEVQHRVHEMEVEFMRQKQELTATWDKEGRQQEHEFNLKLDEMHALLLSSDLKIKLLSKECEVQSQARMQATQALKASEELCKQLQTQLQRKADLKNEATAVKEVRIKELEDKLKWMENKLKKQKDDHIKKHDDMAQVLKEKDDQLESQCQAHKEQLKRAEKHNIKLQDEMEIQSAKAHLAQKDMEMVLEEKDDTVKRLRTEMTRGQTVLERHMSQASNEMVAKNTEFITLQNSNDKLRAELERRREEINRYKQDVSTGLKREVALEQARVQLELEWQRRCDAIKAKHYLDNEQLIQDLTLARDQAKADLSEKEKQLHDLTVLCPSVVSDKAVQGLTPKSDVRASQEISSLVEQNSFLRAVVSQMRKDMEDLGDILPHPQTKLQDASPKAVKTPEAPAATFTTDPLAKHPDVSANTIPAYLSDYTKALKQEVGLLNARCRHLEEQLEGSLKFPSLVPTAGTSKESQAHTYLDKPHPHDQDLCPEKHADSTALRSQVVRGPHAEPHANNIRDRSPVVQQVRDENFSLWQQQLNSTLMAGAASGNVQGVKRNIVLAHARLEQAAAYIARLSREKQQLIQMGNCLRGCINTPGLKEAIEQKRDSSTGEQGHQHDRLSALEQLQYRLTTQELQYAVRQMACTVAEHATSSDSIGPPIKGDSDLCSDGHKTTDESGAFKMSGKTPTINQLRNSLEVKKQPSSEDSQQSLKEIWEILDLGLSSSIYSEGESDLCRSRGTKSGTAGVMVTGTSAPIHSRSPANFQQKKNPSEAPSNPPKNCQHGAPGKIVKIRNYNAKD
ncbi:coiled-coil domain-containing protein 57 isoform X1 [Phycodurus eques]|uniref:coiled-coil domain-containing protein 57 isoform X1 n=2 Tax=Phycodurus eques TaxID=693459 RepID=UPI002ACEFEF2|nr:coiled-coil domain-containing protein 57 isoform X1 [Phycodurus eques]XP_061520031.1 coiled-coil domain-containing protein 57 isoform X1 [Phycodurus eques]XP_061520032.1 coiled-coil domain-containing protein 57 isoform X1 [Phycodurus eques]